MAEVSGTITGANGVEDIVLNNAATEATLRQLLASSLMSNKQTADMVKQFAAKEGLDTSNFNEANENIGGAGKQAELLDKSFRGLDDITKSLQQSFTTIAASLITGTGSFSTIIGAFSKLPLKIAEVVGGMAALYAYQESLLKSYRDLSASGANFSGSLTDMRLAAANAFMSLEHFDTLLKNNSTTLAKMGGTVNDGAIAFSRLQNNIMQSDVGGQLMGLGFSAEEVGQGMLTYINATGGRSKAELANTQEITSATGEYLVELDKLTQFTGTSRKEQEEIQKKAAVNGAYQMALSQMSEKDRAKAAAGLSMAATQGKGAMEHFMASVAGMPDITKDSQQYAGMFGGAASNLTDMADASKDSSKTMKDLEYSFGRANEEYVNGVYGSKDALSAQAMAGNQFANDALLSGVKLKNQGADTAEGTAKLFNDISNNQKEQNKSQAADAAQTELAVKKMTASILTDLMPVLKMILTPLNWLAQAFGFLANTVMHSATLMTALGAAIVIASAPKIGSMLYRYQQGGGGLKGVAAAFMKKATKRDGQSPETAFFVAGGGAGAGGLLDMLKNSPSGPSSEHLNRRAAREASVAWGRVAKGIKNLDSSAVMKGLTGALTTGIKGAGPAIAGLGVGIAADIASDALKNSGHEKMGAATGILGDAATGALTGLEFGPWGAAIGGLAGLAYGVYKNWDDLTSSNNEAAGSPSQQVEKVKEDSDAFNYARAQAAEHNKLLKEQNEAIKQQTALMSSIDKNTWTTAGAVGFKGYMV
jgi:hypothetical protein